MTLDLTKLSWSQLLTALSVLAGISTTILDYVNLLPSKYAQPITAVCLLIASLNERLHGGITKLKYDLAKGEVTKKEVVEEYQKEFEKEEGS